MREPGVLVKMATDFGIPENLAETAARGLFDGTRQVVRQQIRQDLRVGDQDAPNPAPPWTP